MPYEPFDVSKQCNFTQISNWKKLINWLRKNSDLYQYSHTRFDIDMAHYNSRDLSSFAIISEIVPRSNATHYRAYGKALKEHFGDATLLAVFNTDSEFGQLLKNNGSMNLLHLEHVATMLENYLGLDVHEETGTEVSYSVQWNDTNVMDTWPDADFLKKYIEINPQRGFKKIYKVIKTPRIVFDTHNEEISFEDL